MIDIIDTFKGNRVIQSSTASLELAREKVTTSNNCKGCLAGRWAVAKAGAHLSAETIVDLLSLLVSIPAVILRLPLSGVGKPAELADGEKQTTMNRIRKLTQSTESVSIQTFGKRVLRTAIVAFNALMSFILSAFSGTAAVNLYETTGLLKKLEPQPPAAHNPHDINNDDIDAYEEEEASTESSEDSVIQPQTTPATEPEPADASEVDEKDHTATAKKPDAEAPAEGTLPTPVAPVAPIVAEPAAVEETDPVVGGAPAEPAAQEPVVEENSAPAAAEEEAAPKVKKKKSKKENKAEIDAPAAEDKAAVPTLKLGTHEERVAARDAAKAERKAAEEAYKNAKHAAKAHGLSEDEKATADAAAAALKEAYNTAKANYATVKAEAHSARKEAEKEEKEEAVA